MAENRPVGAREERLGENEALFREVNERVAEVAEHLMEVEDHGTRIEFNCECGTAGCTEQMPMTLVEYEAVRAEPIRFAVVPGHEVPDVERVVDRHPNYVVVEKEDEDAAEVGRESDPRA